MTAIHCYYQNQDAQEISLLSEVYHTNHFWSRLKGLLGRKQIGLQEGLLIEPCNSVHTLGMAFPIGVIFIAKDHSILQIIPCMPPQRLSPIIRGAKKVLEMHPERIPAELSPGMKLVFK